MKKSVAIILSGSGHKDGTEITEAVSVVLALSELECSFQFFAPDLESAVKNPIDASPISEKRNVLLESARISRGEIRSLEHLKIQDFDGLAFPGGMGAATVLCDFASRGSQGRAHRDIQSIVEDFFQNQKPILGVCIAPALLALIVGHHKVTLTVGADGETAAELRKTGAVVESCEVTDFITDREHKIITTPAYMYGQARPFEVYTGIRLAVRELVEMC